MKAAMISPYSPRKVTGVGTSIIDLCREFRRDNVDFFLSVPEISEDMPLDSVFSTNDNYFEAPNPKFPFIQNLRVVLFNNRLLRKNRDGIDLVHIFSIKSTTAAAALYSRILNKPVISTIYIMPPAPPDPAKRLLFELSAKIVLKLTTDFAYETAVARKQCGYRPGIIIPEGIDVGHFKADGAARRRIRKKWDIGRDKFVMLYSGRLVESKGIMELLDAVSSMPEDLLENFVLLLIGNVESRGVAGALKKVKDKKWLVHAPPVDRDEIKSYYCAADAFVLPSYYEGVSSSLIEAMSCGLPPVVTAVGGNVEVVKHGKNGLVVEVRNVPALREAVLRILKDKKLQKRLSRSARATVVERFSLKQKADSYIGLYKKVLRDSNRGPDP